MGKKQAYLILAHRKNELLKTLIGLLDDPRFDIYVHMDRRSGADAADLGSLCSKSRLIAVDPVRVWWGGPSMIKAITRLLSAALEGGEYSYFHLISGVDLPLKGPDDIYDCFDGRNGEQFVEMWKMSGDEQERMHHPSLMPEFNRFVLARLVKKAWTALVGRHVRINGDVAFYKAATWFSVTEDFARYVVDERDMIWERFRRLDNCDEQFVGSVAMWGGFEARIAPEGNLRYVDWSCGGRHPRILTMEDRDRLVSSDALWARKFDSRVDNDMIDAVAGQVRKADGKK